jgi:hypothetical protein
VVHFPVGDSDRPISAEQDGVALEEPRAKKAGASGIGDTQ